jgi:hypothetical protein
MYGVSIHKSLGKLERSVLGLATLNQTQIQTATPGHQYFRSTLPRSCCTHNIVVQSMVKFNNAAHCSMKQCHV